jgi:LmbE family N-acetylglucosaminyl deacetylase
MADYQFINIDARTASADIGSFFPGWTGKDEKVCVFSPHDDDALIGAGYAISAAIANGAEVFVFIFCRGNFGYKTVELKDRIEGIRKAETLAAYEKLGVPAANIVHFNYSDNETIHNMGYSPENKFREMMTGLRKNKITRVLVPNHYREHTDHLAVHMIGAFGAAQAGDLILVDWAKPHAVLSVTEYSVWCDFSPEDALVQGRDPSIRANRIIAADGSVEDRIRACISEYNSQIDIIQDLLNQREGRRKKDGGCIEVYLAFDNRPKLHYKAYVDLTEEMERR